MRATEFITELKATKWDADIIDRIIESPKFKSWFGGSKVVHSDGSPMIVYHWTGAKSADWVNKFSPLSHFGTKKAAHTRSLFKDIQIDDFDPPVDRNYGFTIPVFLNIKNPLTLPDFASHNNVRFWDIALINAGIVADDFYSDNISEVLTFLIEETNYDGIKYINKHEDKGSISWIIFDPSQSASIFDFIDSQK